MRVMTGRWSNRVAYLNIYFQYNPPYYPIELQIDTGFAGEALISLKDACVFGFLGSPWKKIWNRITADRTPLRLWVWDGKILWFDEWKKIEICVSKIDMDPLLGSWIFEGTCIDLTDFKAGVVRIWDSSCFWDRLIWTFREIFG